MSPLSNSIPFNSPVSSLKTDQPNIQVFTGFALSQTSADFSPEYGISDEKVQFSDWKNGDFNSGGENQRSEENRDTGQPQVHPFSSWG